MLSWQYLFINGEPYRAYHFTSTQNLPVMNHSDRALLEKTKRIEP